MRPTDLPDTIDLAIDKTALPGDSRSEPAFTAAARFVEAGAVSRLDPTRLEFDPKPPTPERGTTRGPIGSLILHLLPLLTLLAWPRTPLEIPAPIPVQLVIEQPQPPPPPPAEPKPTAKPPAKPPRGNLASEDSAPAEGPKTEKGAGEASPSAGAPPPPAESQAAEVPAKPPPPTEPSTKEPPPVETEAAETIPPKPAPPAEQTKEEPPPVETQKERPTPPKPKPAPPKTQAWVRLPQPLGDSWPLPLHPNETRRTAAHIGPNATRDEYCAYALNLTLRHMDLLPPSFIGLRRGATVLSIRVLADGTIKNVTVSRSSGYPDIDARVEQMVLAVGRFPPLPQWLPGSWMDFRFQLHFPRP